MYNTEGKFCFLGRILMQTSHTKIGNINPIFEYCDYFNDSFNYR